MQQGYIPYFSDIFKKKSKKYVHGGCAKNVQNVCMYTGKKCKKCLSCSYPLCDCHLGVNAKLYRTKDFSCNKCNKMLCECDGSLKLGVCSKCNPSQIYKTYSPQAYKPYGLPGGWIVNIPNKMNENVFEAKQVISNMYNMGPNPSKFMGGLTVPKRFGDYHSPILDVSMFKFIKLNSGYRLAVPMFWGKDKIAYIIKKIGLYGPKSVGFVTNHNTIVPGYLSPGDRFNLSRTSVV